MKVLNNKLKTMLVAFEVTAMALILKSPVVAAGGYGGYGPYGPPPEDTGVVGLELFYFLGGLLVLVGIMFLVNTVFLRKKLNSK